ncbi:MAG TPA: DinB family protein [Bacillota bacterium]|nr:DinB family protein [Bacillota bacterium]
MAALLQTLFGFTWDKEGWEAPLQLALAGVGAAEAAWRPSGGGNTIRQTLNHLNHYDARTLARLTGATPPADVPSNEASFGDPGDPADAAGWEAALRERRRIGDGLQAALGTVPEEKAQDLAAWVLHAAYHTGQIVLIRKQQGSWPATR